MHNLWKTLWTNVDNFGPPVDMWITPSFSTVSSTGNPQGVTRSELQKQGFSTVSTGLNTTTVFTYKGKDLLMTMWITRLSRR